MNKETWTYEEVFALGLMSALKVPQSIIGARLNRSEKSVERKIYHLKGKHRRVKGGALK